MMVVEDLLSILLLAVITASQPAAGLRRRARGTLGGSAGCSSAMIAMGLFVVPRTIRAVARFKRSELMVAGLAICFAMVWVGGRAGYSLALGSFVAGMLIAESGKGPEVDR